MSTYDWQRIRGRHPAACTCADCSAKRRGSRPKKPGAGKHPITCRCPACLERQRKNAEEALRRQGKTGG